MPRRPQLSLLAPKPRPAPPPPKAIAPGWVEVCPLRWVRHAGDFRLVVQLDDPQTTAYRWWVHRTPHPSLRRGTAPSPNVGVLRAEAALSGLAVRS
ncbi:MAG: hypothetical protein ACI8RZ_003776 [Myxococcota bacterium]|jgi:hypothetical protein